MDEEARNLETLATRALAQRGLPRAQGALAFLHKGQRVEVTIEKSVYRGYFVTVHDGHGPSRQFRAIGGGYDWNAIAAHIMELAEKRANPTAPAAGPTPLKERNRRLADELSTMTGAGPDSLLSIEPSPSALGRVRVRLEEIDLDPVSVIELYTAISRALPQQSNRRR